MFTSILEPTLSFATGVLSPISLAPAAVHDALALITLSRALPRGLPFFTSDARKYGLTDIACHVMPRN